MRRSEKIPSGPDLDALIAERVMGWKEVQRQGSRSWGKKQDKAGRWRRAAVPDYSAEPSAAYAVEARVQELGIWEKYLRQLMNIAHRKRLPVEWASPEDRCRAALEAVGKTRHVTRTN